MRRMRQELEASLGYIASFSQPELDSKILTQPEKQNPRQIKKNKKVKPEALKHLTHL